MLWKIWNNVLMRVLVNVPSLKRPGGVANYYRALRRYLPDGIEYFTIGSQLDSEGVWKIIVRSLKDYRDFFRLLKHGSYDLVHLNPSLGSRAVVRDGIFLLIAKAMKIKVVVFMRGWDVGFEQVLLKYFLPVFRYVFLKADAYIVLGNEFKDKLRSIGFSGQVFLETTVVADEVFEKTADCSVKVAGERDEAGINILMLTRVEKAKGVYEGIGAYRLLKSVSPSATLTIAGSGSELQALERYAHDMGIADVTFPGFVDGEAKCALFEQADIYLFPTSYGEGMPNAVLEAMAYGLPVVTRPVGGVRDFFENGKMGFITESLDPHRFAILLEKLVADSEMRMNIGAFNRDYARKHFMASGVTGRLQEIYRKVLNEPAVH